MKIQQLVGSSQYFAQAQAIVQLDVISRGTIRHYANQFMKHECRKCPTVLSLLS